MDFLFCCNGNDEKLQGSESLTGSMVEGAMEARVCRDLERGDQSGFKDRGSRKLGRMKRSAMN